MSDFLITDFGARECDKMQTVEIQAALDACFLAGGGRVIIPCGVFHTGGLRLRSNTILYLKSGAILRGSRNPDDYLSYLDDEIEPIVEPTFPAAKMLKGGSHPFSRWNSGLIKVISAKNVSIIGEQGSYIDGRDCFDHIGEAKFRGPHAINIFDTESIYLEGYTVIDSANWAHNIFCSKNITVRNIKVLGGHDGFDVRTCDNILVEDSTFLTGDDCIAGFDNKCVVIRNCIMDSACSVFRFGGTDVLIENCKATSPASYGFRRDLDADERRLGMLPTEKCRHTTHTVFQYYCDFRAEIRYTPGNIIIKNCEFKNTNSLFLHLYDGMHKWCTNRPLTSIVFEDTEIMGLSLAGVLCSDSKEPLVFKMKNCFVSSREDEAEFPIFEAKNCKEIVLDGVTVRGFKKPTVVTDNKNIISIKNSDDIEVTEKADFEFSNPYVEASGDKAEQAIFAKEKAVQNIN